MSQIVPPKLQIGNSESFKKKSQRGLKFILIGIILMCCGAMFLFFPILTDLDWAQKFSFSVEEIGRFEKTLGYALVFIGVILAGVGLNMIPNVKQPPNSVIH